MKHHLNRDHPCIFYCSGTTATDINHFLERVIDWSPFPIVVDTDASKFDGSQGPAVIHGEHVAFDRAGAGLHVGSFVSPHATDEYNEVWKKSTAFTRTTGRSHGQFVNLKYPGTRKTGDMSTSCGNSRVSLMAHLSFMRIHDIDSPQDFKMMVLGDDIVVFFRPDRFRAVFKTHRNYEELLTRHAASLGFNFKVHVSSEITEGQFISLRFYPTASGYRVGKKPGRTLAKIGYTLVRQGRKPNYLAAFKGTLASLMGTCNHVPFLRVYVQECYSALSDITSCVDESYQSVTSEEVYEADAATFAAFQNVYGSYFTVENEERFRRSFKARLKSSFCFTMNEDWLNILVEADM